MVKTIGEKEAGAFINKNTNKYQIASICASGETTTIKALGVY
jgi:hypothetical protein